MDTNEQILITGTFTQNGNITLEVNMQQYLVIKDALDRLAKSRLYMRSYCNANTQNIRPNRRKKNVLISDQIQPCQTILNA